MNFTAYFTAKQRAYFFLTALCFVSGTIDAKSIKLSESTQKEIKEITDALINPKDKKTSWKTICNRYISCLKSDRHYKPGTDLEKLVKAFEDCASCKKSADIKKHLEQFESPLRSILVDIYGWMHAYRIGLKEQMERFAVMRAHYA